MGGLPIRVLLVEDQERWRRFYSFSLQKLPELQVIAEAHDGLEAVVVRARLASDNPGYSDIAPVEKWVSCCGTGNFFDPILATKQPIPATIINFASSHEG